MFLEMKTLNVTETILVAIPHKTLSSLRYPILPTVATQHKRTFYFADQGHLHTNRRLYICVMRD